MTHYQHILVALDLSENTAQVLSKARLLSQQNKARLSAVHVIEPIMEPVDYTFNGSATVALLSIQDEMEESAEKKLNKLMEPLGVLPADQYIVYGRPADQVHQLAKDKNCDLIIIGSHGRHGLALLLGSTANAVLHGANCDVLAVRFKE
jgi:universal stress protein A|tara:strand:+ start:114275 stop:114721 length:447 start_codon:yes stop_codon:yes gene_type:complete